MTEKDYLEIVKGIIVDPDDCHDWIKRNVVGGITIE